MGMNVTPSTITRSSTSLGEEHRLVIVVITPNHVYNILVTVLYRHQSATVFIIAY